MMQLIVELRKTMRKIFREVMFIVGCLMSLFLVTSCAHHGAFPPLPTTKYNLEDSAEFVLLDAGIRKTVSCTSITHLTLEDGRLEIKAKLFNLVNRRIEVQINCVFKDEEGFIVDETPFQTLILMENSVETKNFVSINNKAKRFIISVRQPR